MARTINRLNARTAATITKPGRHADGGGLYLSISANGGRRWVFLYRWREPGTKGAGAPTEIGLGSARDVSLACARELATEKRAQLAQGINPKHEKKPAEARTFDAVARELIASMEPSWRNPKHRAQWYMTLLAETPPDERGETKPTEHDYCKSIRHTPVGQLRTDDVLKVLKPLWQTRPETASRLRGRIERVLDAAKARDLRSGENPARWRGHLDQLLARRHRLTRGHHAAMPYTALPGFLVRLCEQASISARALEYAILTAARSGEVLGARWDEIDLDGAVWTVPPERMKGGKEHRVPLSPRALEIVNAMHELRDGPFVFPGQKRGKPLSTMALEMVLRRMKVDDATVHGFRSSFRDWAAERTHFPNEVCEAALAHVIENKAEAAYRRGDLFNKRRKLMEAWAEYCARSSGDATVIPLQGANRGNPAAA
jgi:integrase